MITKLKTYKENILVPRNINGRGEKLKQETIKLLSQETIDGGFELELYMLDIPDNLVKVKVINGDFLAQEMDLEQIPTWCQQIKIKGDFYCNGNKLTSLEGCPYYIGGTFDCTYNNLTSLKYGPKYVGGEYYCWHNYDAIKLEKPKDCVIKGGFYNK